MMLMKRVKTVKIQIFFVKYEVDGDYSDDDEYYLCQLLELLDLCQKIIKMDGFRLLNVLYSSKRTTHYLGFRQSFLLWP